MADFGDILSQWESRGSGRKKKPQVPNKKANAGHCDSAEKKQATKQPGGNAMEQWLSRYGVVDKDALAGQSAQSRRMHDQDFLRKMRPQETIDLHGLTRDEAWQRLDAFVGTCRRDGIQKILIIHGKGIHSHGGDAVLQQMVRQFVEQDPRLGQWGHPDHADGGTGATWAIIRP